MNIIERINNHLNIEEILELLPTLEAQGNNYIGKCPTGHASVSGKSFQVNTIEPTFHCFNCGVYGNYIHLIELIKFGTSSAGKTGSQSFKETLKFLADKYGLNDDNQGYQENESVYDIIDWLVADYHEQFEKEDELIQLALNNYGFTKEFLINERWGFGAGCPARRALDFWSMEELLSTGLFYKTRSGIFHIYQNRIVIPYSIMGRVRYTIGRTTRHNTPYIKDGKTIDPPKYFKQLVKNKAHPFVSEQIKNQIVKCHKDFDEILIAEGITDYLAAKMHGMNAVSAVTTSFKKSEAETVSDLCGKFKRVYVANDNEENKAGNKGAAKICEMLISNRINPYVVILPLAEGASKIDLAEFLRDNGGDKFKILKEKSITYIEFLINQIPRDIDKQKLLDELELPLSLLSNFESCISDIYISDYISKRFKLSNMRTFLSAIKKIVGVKIKNREDNEAAKEARQVTDNVPEPMTVIRCGQEYRKGVLYYVITREFPKEDKDGYKTPFNQKFLISSEGWEADVSKGHVESKNILLNSRKGNEKFSWWNYKESPHSTENYLAKKTNVDPAELYRLVKDIFDRHIYFKKDYESKFLAVAVMTWPMFMVFKAIGLIHLWAEKQSGKTTIMEILKGVGFNSLISSSITPAAMYRSIEANRHVVLVDEAEHLNPSKRARENAPSELLELYKSSYKSSGSATRCEGLTHDVVSFSTYSPKVFASIGKIDPVLAERTIVVRMTKIPPNEEKESLANKEEEFQEIRNMTYCFGMQFASTVDEISTKELNQHSKRLKKYKIISRLRELWGGYLSIALLIDKYDSSLKVFDSLMRKAKEGDEEVQALSDNPDARLVELLYLWTKQVKKGKRNDMEGMYHGDGDIYMVEGLRMSFVEHILKRPEEDEIYDKTKAKHVTKLLVRLHIIDSVIKNHLLPGDDKRKVVVHLEPDRMLRALMNFKHTYDDEVAIDIQAYKIRNNISLNGDLIPTIESEGLD